MKNWKKREKYGVGKGRHAEVERKDDVLKVVEREKKKGKKIEKKEK